MGRKGVSKRKPKGQKPKILDSANSGLTSVISSLTQETDAQASRALARGQAISSGKDGKKKYSESKTNKKK